MSSKVSFTVRRPTPVSRDSSGGDSERDFKIPALPKHLAGGSIPGSPLASAPASPKPNSRRYAERDSSDEEDEDADELVTGFDAFGVQRLHEKKAPEGPLVIPALKNRDWRELARKRKQLYVPPSAAATTGADGSVGGLGTRDTINSGPQLSGLQARKRVKTEEDMDVEPAVEDASSTAKAEDSSGVNEGMKKEETEDERALRVILASAANIDGGDTAAIAAIPAPSEDDAYRQDVQELPEEASLDAYERVPVAQFGAALLRGMGWKEGMAASKKNRGMVEPWLPQARPALLGIGAKEKEVFDDGSKKKGKARPEKRYVPVVKRERAREDSESSGSRRRSSGPEERREKDRDRRDEYERDDRDHSRDKRESDRRNDYDRDRRNRDGARDREADRNRYRESDPERDGDRRRDDYRDGRYDSDSRRRDNDRSRR